MWPHRAVIGNGGSGGAGHGRRERKGAKGESSPTLSNPFSKAYQAGNFRRSSLFMNVWSFSGFGLTLVCSLMATKDSWMI